MWGMLFIQSVISRTSHFLGIPDETDVEELMYSAWQTTQQCNVPKISTRHLFSFTSLQTFFWSDVWMLLTLEQVWQMHSEFVKIELCIFCNVRICWEKQTNLNTFARPAQGRFQPLPPLQASRVCMRTRPATASEASTRHSIKIFVFDGVNKGW